VVVSGGARGLGLAIVGHLLQEGYAVSTFSRHSTQDMEHLAAAYPDRLIFAPMDMTGASARKAFVRSALDGNGPIYGLVNNAAFARDGILATLPEVEIHRMLSLNLEAAILLTRLCLREMIKTPGGRVINISSIIGTRGYNGLAVYSATKAGLDGFTRSLAREVGRRGITVNSIAPGYMDTQMSSELSVNQKAQIINRTPLKRLAKVQDVIPLVSFLLSDQAQMITGQTIIVDGGISC
jgi:3-oxoacyl-[acyl-carrier protein] reductase